MSKESDMFFVTFILFNCFLWLNAQEQPRYALAIEKSFFQQLQQLCTDETASLNEFLSATQEQRELSYQEVCDATAQALIQLEQRIDQFSESHYEKFIKHLQDWYENLVEMRAPRPSDNPTFIPNLLQLTYIPRDMFIQGQLVVGGDLTVTGTINGATFPGDFVINIDGSQNNAIARFEGTAGNVIKNSALILTDISFATQNNVALQADDGSTTDIDLALVAKGTGALTAQIPDGSSVGGDARGNYAVDFQRQRNFSSQVASGANAAVVSGINNTAAGFRSFVGGGEGNNASANYTVITGGLNNVASELNAVVSGGENNNASGHYSSIGGGQTNTASGDYSVIAGGGSNIASGSASFAAGRNAQALNDGSFVWADSSGGTYTDHGTNTFNVRATNGTFISNDLTVGGTITASNFPGTFVQGPPSSQDNAIARFNGTSGNLIQNSAVVLTDFTSSTQNNVAIKADDGTTANIDLALVPKGTGALVAAIPDGTGTGGNARGNNAVDLQMVRTLATRIASGAESVLIGGDNNLATNTAAVCIGGTTNGSSGVNSIALAGSTNITSGTNSIVSGNQNSISPAGTNAACIGGLGNSISDTNSVALGGNLNTITNNDAAIVAGQNNNTDGAFSVICAGTNNTIANSGQNSGIFASTNSTANGLNAVVCGGQLNNATGDRSFAAGSRAQATSIGSFVWADNSVGTNFSDNGAQTFNIRAANGGFFSNNLSFNNSVHQLSAIGSHFNSLYRVVTGQVNTASASGSGDGFTWTRTAVGSVTVTYTAGAFTTTPFVVASAVAGATADSVSIQTSTSTEFQAVTFTINVGIQDGVFNFIAIGK